MYFLLMSSGLFQPLLQLRKRQFLRCLSNLQRLNSRLPQWWHSLLQDCLHKSVQQCQHRRALQSRHRWELKESRLRKKKERWTKWDSGQSASKKEHIKPNARQFPCRRSQCGHSVCNRLNNRLSFRQRSMKLSSFRSAPTRTLSPTRTPLSPSPPGFAPLSPLSRALSLSGCTGCRSAGSQWGLPASREEAAQLCRACREDSWRLGCREDSQLEKSSLQCCCSQDSYIFIVRIFQNPGLENETRDESFLKRTLS